MFQRSYPRDRGHSVMIEHLESRRLLSTATSLGATVTIDGSRRNDQIIISRTTDGHYEVVDNSTHLTYRASRVKRFVINCRGGDDILSVDNSNGGVAAAREVHGGDGNDTLSGGKGADDFFGDAGDDRLDGRQGDDDLHGGDDNDSLEGDIGDDSLDGGNGDDNVDGGDGTDHVDGGAGHDTFHGGHDSSSERKDDTGEDQTDDDMAGVLDDGAGHDGGD